MKKMVILTFPNPMAKADLEKLRDALVQHTPEIKWCLIDNCSGATVVQIPDTANAS